MAELSGADTCVTPVLSVAELVDDEQFTSRHAFVEAVAGPPTDGEDRPSRFRQVGAVFAGMEDIEEPVTVTDPLRTDTEQLLTQAGIEPARIAELRAKGVVG